MQQIDTTTAVATMPAIPATGPGPQGWFTAGNPQTGTPATQISQDWLNALQLEIVNLLAAAGLTPSRASQSQITQAIRTIAGTWQYAAGGAVQAATTAALPSYAYANGTAGVGATLAATANGAFPAVDGVAAAVNNRYWVKNETGANAPYNGIYVLTALGSGSAPWVLTRAADADTAAELAFIGAYVISGTANEGNFYIIPLAASAITVGTTALDPILIFGNAIFATIYTQIAAETVRAEAAESSLASSITSQVAVETSRAEAAEAALLADIGALATPYNFLTGGPVKWATAAALPSCTYNNGTAGVGATLTATANGALSVDGNAVSTGDRVLVDDQASALQNGVYAVSNAGSAGAPWVLTRATDANTPGLLAACVAYVTSGSMNALTQWLLPLSASQITIGTTALAFVSLPDRQFLSQTEISLGTVATLLSAYSSGVALPNGITARCVGRDSLFDSPAISLVYAYNASDTTSADDGGSIRVDGAGRRWYAIGDIYVDHFGMHTSNSGAANNTPYQNALAWLKGSNNGYSGRVLNVYANYTVSESGNLTANLGINNCEYGMTIRGRNPFSSMIIGSGFATPSPLLDASGQPDFRLENIFLNAQAGCTAAFWNGALPNSSTSLNGQENGGNYFKNVTILTAGSNAICGMAVQACDVSVWEDIYFYGSTGSSDWYTGWAPGLMAGWALPTNPNDTGLCQSGSTTTQIVLAQAPVFSPVGRPILVSHSTSLGNSATFEAHYITAYNASTLTITLDSALGITPGTGNAYAIGAIASVYQPLAGTGDGGGATEYRVGAAVLNGIYLSGCTDVFLDEPYLTSYGAGTGATAVVVVDGKMSGGATNLIGKMNAEYYGTGNGVMIAAINGAQIGLVELAGGRYAGPFNGGLFYSDSASGIVSIYANGAGSTVSQPILALSQTSAVEMLVFDDYSASTFGTVTPGIICNCELNANIAVSTVIAAGVQAGTVNGQQIAPYQAWLGAPEPGQVVGPHSYCVPALSMAPVGTTSNTTGGSSQLRVSLAFPANAIAYQGGYPLGCIECAWGIQNNKSSTTAVALALHFGSTTTNFASFNLPASAYAEVRVRISSSGNVFYSVFCTTSPYVLACGNANVSGFAPTASWSLQVFENNAAGDATSMEPYSLWVTRGQSQ